MEVGTENNGSAAVGDQAIRLAQKHYAIEDGITRIFRIRMPLTCDSTEFAADSTAFTADQTEVVGLLEVNANTVPAGIMPLQFPPNVNAGFQYPMMILEVTPGEYEEIKSGSLSLPARWEIGEEIPRADVLGNREAE